MLAHDNRPHPKPMSVMGRACLLLHSVLRKPWGFPLSHIDVAGTFSSKALHLFGLEVRSVQSQAGLKLKTTLLSIICNRGRPRQKDHKLGLGVVASMTAGAGHAARSILVNKDTGNLGRNLGCGLCPPSPHPRQPPRSPLCFSLPPPYCEPPFLLLACILIGFNNKNSESAIGGES